MRIAGSLIAAVLCLAGCTPAPVNPSFNISLDAAHADLVRMRDDARPAARPIVVIGGYADPGIAAPAVARNLCRCLSPDAKVISVQPGFVSSMDSARDQLIDAVGSEFPSADPDRTVEVDVVAVSMGGLVARYAAIPREHAKRLCIGTLYTYSSPHRGAQTAVVPSLESRVIDMRPGSRFLATLDAAERDYAIVPYVRLGDFIVGAANTAPPGFAPHWVPTPPFQTAHIQVFSDDRILADIARRLRGEPSWTTDPASPLPGAEN